MLCVVIFGLYGVVLFFFFMISYLVKLKSFGVFYMSLVVFYCLSEWKDLMVCMFFMMMKRCLKMMYIKDFL